MSPRKPEPVYTPVTVPWGMTWKIGQSLVRIEDVVEHGRVLRTEAYVIGHPDKEDEMHNPIGHFSGSRQHCWNEIRRMLDRHYRCQPGERCPCHLHEDSTCKNVRDFLEVKLPNGVLYPSDMSECSICRRVHGSEITHACE